MANSFFQRIQDGVASLATDAKKFKNKKFMNAAVAGCALVAFADGVIDAAEKRKMFAFMRQNEELSVYDATEISEAFEKYLHLLESDFELGKGECLRVIHQVKSDTGASRLIIRVCGAIASSDGVTDKAEEQVIREICNELGLQASEFGL